MDRFYDVTDQSLRYIANYYLELLTFFSISFAITLVEFAGFNHFLSYPTALLGGLAIFSLGIGIIWPRETVGGNMERAIYKLSLCLALVMFLSFTFR